MKSTIEIQDVVCIHIDITKYKTGIDTQKDTDRHTRAHSHGQPHT